MSRPQLVFYRGGQARCGHGCADRIGQHRTISGYVIARCPRCERHSLIFGAHGYCAVRKLHESEAAQLEGADLTVTEVLAQLGLLAS